MTEKPYPVLRSYEGAGNSHAHITLDMVHKQITDHNVNHTMTEKLIWSKNVDIIVQYPDGTDAEIYDQSLEIAERDDGTVESTLILTLLPRR